MPPPRRAHDRRLLDALEAHTPEAFVGVAWRVVRAARDPLQGYPAGGRWDPPGAFEVLYTSLETDGALAEVHFHLSRAPVFPSRTLYRLHQIRVATRRTLRLADLRLLAGLGVDEPAYAGFDYTATQAIGAAAHFLEFDGLLVPSARFPCLNLVLFLDRLAADTDLRVARSTDVDWTAWLQKPQ